ncbi:AEC family transporter [soil metagenome]
MGGVLIGFAVIGFVILVGYIVARSGVLGEQGAFVFGRAGFYVLSPFLLFTVLSQADVHVLFSSLLLVSAIAAVASMAVFVAVSRAFFRRPVSETVIGTLASSYVNANNIGIPVALYVLGDAAYSAPIVLLQLLVFVPVALTILDVQARGSFSARRILFGVLSNPIIIGSALGVLVAVLRVRLPDPVLEPLRLIGAAAVPIVLLSFGMSLHGQRPLAAGSSRRDVLLASALKVAFMPTVAWLVGHFLFHLREGQLFAVVVLAALPTAQNVFNYAQRYERGQILARDVVLITTVLCVPALFVVAALLAPG